MEFDAQGFLQAKLAPRTRTVSVPALAEWFGGDTEQAMWLVRSLTANELAKINEAEARNRREGALLEAISSGSRSEIVEEMQHALGRGKDTRPDLARRLEMLTLGSVEPECSEELAVRLAEKYPVQFFELTNAVLDLTGRGSESEKKQEGSGAIQKSEPA